MKITYKYKIGQKVKLVKNKLYNVLSRYEEIDKLIGQEVTIIDGDMFKAVISYPLYWEN